MKHSSINVLLDVRRQINFIHESRVLDMNIVECFQMIESVHFLYNLKRVI